MSHFKEDSPDFRKSLQDQEDSLQTLSSVLKLWTERASTSFAKGQDYCQALSALITTIDESSQLEVLLPYRNFISSITDVLSTVQACNEGIVHSLSQVFPSKLEAFCSSVQTDLQSLKKSYEKNQKDLELLRASTLSYKKSYVKKNPSSSEEHFVKVHSAEKLFETSRFEYFSFLNCFLFKGQLLAVEQCLSLLYSIYSFTNTTLERYKLSEKEINNITERLPQYSRGLSTLQETLKKEKEAQEIRVNMFVKIPQYKESKCGYLWKRGNLLTEWKRRYFFIQDSQLFYLRDQTQVPYIPLHMIKAYESKDSDHLYSFEIVSVSPLSKFTLLADSESEMKEWLHVLTRSSEQGLLGYSDTDYSCADCLTVGPEWCSLNLGVLLCANCSGIHRSLGSHLSKVRSLSLDNIDPVSRSVIYELHKEHANIWGDGFRPPRFCANEEREEYIRSKYCLKTWIKKVENPNSALINAVENGNLVKAFHAIVSGAKDSNNGILHIAAKNGKVEVVALLLTCGWQIEAKNHEAFTPLEVALLAGKNEVVEYIVKSFG